MDMVAAMFRTIFAQADAAGVGKAWDQVRDQLTKSFPKISRVNLKRRRRLADRR